MTHNGNECGDRECRDGLYTEINQRVHWKLLTFLIGILLVAIVASFTYTTITTGETRAMVKAENDRQDKVVNEKLDVIIRALSQHRERAEQ